MEIVNFLWLIPIYIVFSVYILARPRIDDSKLRLEYRKDMILNCTIKEANPDHVYFTWDFCDKSSCGANITNWQFVSNASSVTVKDPKVNGMKYRCTARNLVGSDVVIFEVKPRLSKGMSC